MVFLSPHPIRTFLPIMSSYEIGELETKAVVRTDDRETKPTTLSTGTDPSLPVVNDTSADQATWFTAPEVQSAATPFQHDNKLEESPVDPGYCPTDQPLLSVNPEARRVSTCKQHQRRSSESFFDSSSSDGEEEDSAAEDRPPEIGQASRLTISRVSNVVDQGHRHLVSASEGRSCEDDNDSNIDPLETTTPPLTFPSLRDDKTETMAGQQAPRLCSAPLGIAASRPSIDRKVVVKPIALNTSHAMCRQSIDLHYLPTPYPYDEQAQHEMSPTTVLPEWKDIEVLFLDIGLARHPQISISVEIELSDKKTFDDEALFIHIQSAYHKKLLGWSRIGFRFIRDVTHVSMNNHETAGAANVPTHGFMQHFLDPRLGRKRTSWITWLQKMNHHRKSRPFNEPEKDDGKQRRSSSIVESARKRLGGDVDVLRSPLSHAVFDSLTTYKMSSGHGDDESNPKGLVEAHIHNTTATSSDDIFSDEHTDMTRLRVNFHHGFNSWVIAFLFVCTLWLSISSVIMWTFIGVPSVKYPVQATIGRSVMHAVWEYDSERVLTGLVLGIMVLMTGVLAELCLIAGGWILL